VSVVVVGLSHHTCPLELLERCALDADAVTALCRTLTGADDVTEVAVLATCNRLEVYVETRRFHAAVTAVGQALAAATGVGLGELQDGLFIHFEEAAVRHLFEVSGGLDSMAVGEGQILGQVRTALRIAEEAGTCGRVLGPMLRAALRAGKRVRTDTELDGVGRSLLGTGLDLAAGILGPLDRARVLVVGAGAMSSLAVATARRAGAATVTVASRTLEHADRLAGTAGASAVPMTDLAPALADAELVITATGAPGQVLDVDAASAALAARNGAPQVYLDLALPRDVAPEVADLPGAHVVDLEVLGHELATGNGAVMPALAAARSVVAEEVAAYLASRSAGAVAPTVVALRARASAVVEAELGRLASRLGEVDARVLAEVEQTVHRVVEKLLHTPTVRVKELASGPQGETYARALRELFDLETPCTDPAVVGLGPAPLRALNGGAS